MPDSLPPEDEIARLRVEKGQGASLTGPGSQASPEAPPDLRPEGFDPSREEYGDLHEALDLLYRYALLNSSSPSFAIQQASRLLKCAIESVPVRGHHYV